MSIAELSIRKRATSVTLILVAMIGGLYGYSKMGRLEDPEFTIKDAQVITPYPHASAKEVEEEVSDEIEQAAQQLGQLKRVVSRSQRGLSIVTVTIKDKYGKNALPQVWDELRRKVNDARSSLPPGAGPSFVNDDYGDVYGIFLAITGDGYSFEEVRRYADMLKRELLLARDVKKIILYGVVPEAVYVQISRAKMTSLGISPEQIYGVLREKNLVADGGRAHVGDEYIPITLTGEYASVEELGGMLIAGLGTDRLVYLKDVAEIIRDYKDPPDELLRFDGKPAIGIAISTVEGGNVVTMGRAIETRLAQLESQRPVGMDLNIVSYQSRSVTEAVNGFVINLVEAVLIVIIVLLIFMGLRSGMIIGGVLVITIAATLLVMFARGITLERISLGALIIALGMLVDNAIVVTEGMLVGIEGGEDRMTAARRVVGQSKWPLLGATVVAILAFGPIGLSQDNTGEYCRSLFLVLMISLLASWLTAITATPLLCHDLFRPKKALVGETSGDPYQGAMYKAYRRFVAGAIRVRWVTLAILVGLLVLAMVGFQFVENSFFPPSTRPQFMVDVWLPKGTDIIATRAVVAEMEQRVASMDHVQHVTSFVGKGGPRFLLTYAPERPDSGYAQILIDVDDYRVIEQMRLGLQRELSEDWPEATITAKKFLLGPGDGGKIQLRLSGPGHEKLRQLADRARAIMSEDPMAVGIRSDWREKEKRVVVEYNEAKASRLGVTRTDVAEAIQSSFSGVQVGVYREEDRLLPIISRSPLTEREDVARLADVQVWSPVAQEMVPLTQVVLGTFRTEWEDAIIWRRNRIPTVTVHADPIQGNASVVLERIMPRIEAMFGEARESGLIDDEYFMEWGGEYENSRNGQAGLAASIPMFAVLMVLIVIVLFNAIRQPLIIWLCVPLATIGVTAGLLITGQPFGFMALLGLLSLSGMLIKNAIVLIDQINLEISEGKPPYNAVLDSAVSRMRPVLMATATTVLGMAPLLQDAFYISMAVTIMFGLSFAAVLTLVIVPVLYCVMFRIRQPARAVSSSD